MATLTQDEKIINYVKDTNLQHIAIIMDGNRRWAKQKGLPSAFGHKKGVDSLKTIMRACDDFGIKYLTVYAFSTKTLQNELQEMHENGVVINFIGDIKRLNPKLQEILAHSVEVTKNNTGVRLQIAFNYGSRDEIVHAVKCIVQKVKNSEIDIDDINEDLISDSLYTKNIPDPDLLIRTGGEMRISNYLLWQIAYSEFFVTKTLWPDFDKSALADAVEEFHSRQRRFGK